MARVNSLKFPVSYKGLVYEGRIFADLKDPRVRWRLKLGPIERIVDWKDDSMVRKMFDEMILELEKIGELSKLNPDPYLTEMEKSKRNPR